MSKLVLSRRQQAILRFLYRYSQSNGFYPTIREICEGTQTSSTSVVKYHLEQLKRSHQQEIEAYTQERAQLVGEIRRLRLTVPA